MELALRVHRQPLPNVCFQVAYSRPFPVRKPCWFQYHSSETPTQCTRPHSMRKLFTLSATAFLPILALMRRASAAAALVRGFPAYFLMQLPSLRTAEGSKMVALQQKLPPQLSPLPASLTGCGARAAPHSYSRARRPLPLTAETPVSVSHCRGTRGMAPSQTTATVAASLCSA